MPVPFDPVDVIGLPIDQKRSLQGERLKALVTRLASCGMMATPSVLTFP